MRGWTVSERESSSEPITVGRGSYIHSSEPITVGNRSPFEPSDTGTLIIDV